MLENLILENFKSLKEGNFHLQPLTLFCGLNGMGKSSALQSLLLLRQSFEKNLIQGEGLALNGDYVKLGTGKDIFYSEAENDEIAISVQWSNSSLDSKFVYQEKSDVQPISGEELVTCGAVFDESLFTSSFQYLSAERISPKTIYDVSEYAVNQRRSVGIKGEFTAHFLSVHGDDSISLEALKHPDSPTKLLIDNVNAWMSEITPGTKVIAKLIPEINQVSLHYQFVSSTELTPQFRPENTGFGLTYVLPVVTAILSAKSGDLLLIENPESHLHPAGQSVIARIVSLAAENGVQIIVETHSDHFLNGVRISVLMNKLNCENIGIYYLSRDLESPSHTVRIDPVNIDKFGRIKDWPDGFFDEWDKSLTALAFSRNQ